MTKFRKGDICTIEVVVDSNPFGDNDVRVRQPGGYSDIYTKTAQLTMLRPSFEIGDKVTWSSGDGSKSYTGHILSIAEDHLWVSLGDGVYSTVWAGNAMRVDAEPEPAVEPAPVEEAA